MVHLSASLYFLSHGSVPWRLADHDIDRETRNRVDDPWCIPKQGHSSAACESLHGPFMECIDRHFRGHGRIAMPCAMRPWRNFSRPHRPHTSPPPPPPFTRPRPGSFLFPPPCVLLVSFATVPFLPCFFFFFFFPSLIGLCISPRSLLHYFPTFRCSEFIT